MKRIIIALLLLSSCATGRQLGNIQPGMSQSDVRSILGRPSGVGLNSDGLRYYVYNYANHSALPISGGRSKYFVLFDKEGKVKSYGSMETLNLQ